MAAKNVDIRIDTTADDRGAKKAQAALEKLSAANEKAAAKAVAVAEKAAAKEIVLAEKTANAKIRQEEKASEAINREAARRSKIRERESAKSDQELGATARSAGQKAAQVGFQVQDIAVQAQAGINASTILAQQGSQLLGAFGTSGALAGGILAIGAVSYKVFTDMAKNAAVTGEAMEDMSEKLKEAFNEQSKKAIEDFNASLQSQTQLAGNLRDAELALFETRNLRAESDARLIKSQLALDEAAIKYLATTGQIVDQEQALIAARNKAAEAEAQALIDSSLAQVETERKKYDLFVQQRDDITAEVSKAESRLAELEQRQQEIGLPLSQARGMDKTMIKAGLEKEGFKSGGTVALEGEMESIRKQIDSVYKVIQGAPARIEQITNDSYNQAVAVDAAIAQSQVKIQEITTQLNLEQKAQQLNQAVSSITSDAQEITKEIATIEAVTPIQQEAKAAIQKAASDGVITAQEQVEIGRNLSILLAGMKTGQTESLNTVRDLIQLNNEMAVKMNAMNKELNGIRERVQRIPVR